MIFLLYAARKRILRQNSITYFPFHFHSSIYKMDCHFCYRCPFALYQQNLKKIIITINYYIIRYMYTVAFLLMPDPSFNTKLSFLYFLEWMLNATFGGYLRAKSSLGLYFSQALFEGLLFGGAYIRSGLYTVGNLHYKTDWVSF